MVQNLECQLSTTLVFLAKIIYSGIFIFVGKDIQIPVEKRFVFLYNNRHEQ